MIGKYLDSRNRFLAVDIQHLNIESERFTGLIFVRKMRQQKKELVARSLKLAIRMKAKCLRRYLLKNDMTLYC